MSNLNPRKRKPNICLRCDGKAVQVRHKEDVLDYKGLTLEVAGLADTACIACGHEWTTDGQEQDNLALIREAFALKRDAVRTKEGLLTGEQIADVLDQLHIAKAEAATLFGGGPNAFGKYISGEVLQSFAMDRLLRLTLGFGSHALRYLRLGANAPLSLNGGGYFVAPTFVTTTLAETTDIVNKDDLVIMETRATNDRGSFTT